MVEPVETAKAARSKPKGKPVEHYGHHFGRGLLHIEKLGTGEPVNPIRLCPRAVFLPYLTSEEPREIPRKPETLTQYTIQPLYFLLKSQDKNNPGSLECIYSKTFSYFSEVT